MARTTVAGSDIRIDGLVDLQRELRKINDQLPKELGDVNKQVADFVVRRAKGRASTPLEHRAADTLKAARQQRVALVRLGGAKYPEALGAEFGAIRDIPRNTARGTVRGWNQFREWRRNGIDAGYFLFPTIREDTPQIIDLYADLIDRLCKRAFPD
jgi:hypothetical protein